MYVKVSLFCSKTDSLKPKTNLDTSKCSILSVRVRSATLNSCEDKPVDFYEITLV